MKVLLTAALLCLTGCSISRNGVVHHVIIGFGVVSVPTPTNTAAQVTSAKAIGVYAGSGNFYVGAGSLLTANVQTNANVILEIKK